VRLVEWAVRNERPVVIAGLAFVSALGLYATLDSGARLMMQPPGPAFVVLLLVMWWTMMLAMMLPSAAPAILTYAALRRNFIARGVAQPPLTVFISGYGAVWSAFCLGAVALQFATRDLAPLTPMYALTSGLLGGALLLAAGIYQFTPLKNACLRRCQSPLFFFAHRWKNSVYGAFSLGVRHGLHCLGCCWVLMLLLFYGGVMELTWIVGLAAYVAAEKLIPAKAGLGQVAGMGLVVWGGWTMAQSIR
jgi:predicted metal-binding membrane protein